MRIKKSYGIAGFIAVAVVAYFALNAIFGSKDKDDQDNGAPGPKSQAEQIQTVIAVAQTAQDHADEVALRGRTEPVRAVVVRAETGGRVAHLPVPKGAFVKAGQTLCGLEVSARQAQLDQARANLRAKELEYAGSQELEAKGFRSTNATLAAKAARDAALAMVRAAEVEIAHTRITAPYAGVFDDRAVEVGDVLAPGQACGTVVDLNPILVVANATEAEALKIKPGVTGHAKLVNGATISGRIRFVARNPDETTKTYRVELEVANPKFEIPAGVASDLRVATGMIEAHRISPAILALNAAGQVGIRIVDSGNIVRFVPIRLIEETAEGVWVTGLPKVARIITVGQDFVSEGKPVKVAAGAAK